jgi:hypothetical protein
MSDNCARTTLLWVWTKTTAFAMTPLRVVLTQSSEI